MKLTFAVILSILFSFGAFADDWRNVRFTQKGVHVDLKFKKVAYEGNCYKCFDFMVAKPIYFYVSGHAINRAQEVRITLTNVRKTHYSVWDTSDTFLIKLSQGPKGGFSGMFEYAAKMVNGREVPMTSEESRLVISEKEYAGKFDYEQVVIVYIDGRPMKPVTLKLINN